MSLLNSLVSVLEGFSRLLPTLAFEKVKDQKGKELHNKLTLRVSRN